MRSTRVRSAIVSLALVVGSAATQVAIFAQPAQAAWAPPGFVRSVGMRGEPSVYPFGVAFNPVTSEIVVGDYWNYQVRRYDLAGNQLGSFYLSPNQRHGQPYAVMTDPRNGDIYVTEWAEDKPSGWISHWGPQGQFIEDHLLPGIVYDAWGTIDSNGLLYLSDSHATLNNQNRPPQVKVFDLDNDYAPVTKWGTWGTAPGQIRLIHGIDHDSQGNVYVAEAYNLTVNVYSSTGTFLTNFGSKGPEDTVGRFTGDLRGLAIDREHGWVYVVDAEGSQIEKFDLAGNPLTHWGTEGLGAGQFADGGRGITIDGSGHVWVADFGNFRIFEYASDGTLLGTYPSIAQGPPAGGLAQDRDVAVDASGNIWGVDTWNHRVQEFSPVGAFLTTWGFRNSHPPFGMDYPRGVAIDPATQDVWVVNTRDHVIRVYTHDGAYLRTIGSGLQSDADGSFSWPMDVEFAGGKVFVSGYHSAYVKVLDPATGAELMKILGANNGVAVDPATGNIYVLTYGRDRISVYSPTGTFLFRWGTTGSGAGQFQNPWDVDIANGVVYVTDANLGRVSAFDLSGAFLGMWGTKGSGPLNFSAPSGITHDAAGNLYIADALNDRIVEYSPSTPPVSGDTIAPSVAITAPTNGSTLPRTTVVIEGTAADNVAIGTVEISIRNETTNLWWNAKTASWQAAKAFNLGAVIGSSPMRNVTWRAAFVGPLPGGSYRVEVRTTDTSNNRSTTTPSRTFTIA